LQKAAPPHATARQGRAPHLDLAAAHDFDFDDVFDRVKLPELEILLVVVAGAWGRRQGGDARPVEHSPGQRLRRSGVRGNALAPAADWRR
jgi:hypothetical protein